MIALEGHPKLGASPECLVLEGVMRRLGARADEYFLWATHGGAELDLLVVSGKGWLGFEIKGTSPLRLTPSPSMWSALSDLKLRRLDVIYAGE